MNIRAYNQLIALILIGLVFLAAFVGLFTFMSLGIEYSPDDFVITVLAAVILITISGLKS